ncbi:MAG TPA: glycosyltransferase [Gaiellaceae bacterium]|nr:glycosyltransferase [Gaiellaceae bacterium]
MVGEAPSSSADPKVSVVIPCRDAADTLGIQLAALARQEWRQPWEVLVVVDPDEADATANIVETFREQLPNLRRVVGSGRRGQAHALNVGVRAARGESVVFCDADDEVADGWLAAMGDALSRHDFVCGRLEYAKLNEPWVRESREPVFAEGLPTTWFAPHVAYGAAGALGIRRELHEAVGGFDEDAFVVDLEYSLRVQRAGTELVFVPDAVVHYRYRDRLTDIFRQAFKYGQSLAAIERRYGDPGEARPSFARWLVSGWKPAFGMLRRFYRKGKRGHLVWLVGWQLGRYRGSMRHGVRAL